MEAVGTSRAPRITVGKVPPAALSSLQRRKLPAPCSVSAVAEGATGDLRGQKMTGAVLPVYGPRISVGVGAPTSRLVPKKAVAPVVAPAPARLLKVTVGKRPPSKACLPAAPKSVSVKDGLRQGSQCAISAPRAESIQVPCRFRDEESAVMRDLMSRDSFRSQPSTDTQQSIATDSVAPASRQGLSKVLSWSKELSQVLPRKSSSVSCSADGISATLGQVAGDVLGGVATPGDSSVEPAGSAIRPATKGGSRSFSKVPSHALSAAGGGSIVVSSQGSLKKESAPPSPTLPAEPAVAPTGTNVVPCEPAAALRSMGTQILEPARVSDPPAVPSTDCPGAQQCELESEPAAEPKAPAQPKTLQEKLQPIRNKLKAFVHMVNMREELKSLPMDAYGYALQYTQSLSSERSRSFGDSASRTFSGMPSMSSGNSGASAAPARRGDISRAANLRMAHIARKYDRIREELSKLEVDRARARVAPRFTKRVATLPALWTKCGHVEMDRWVSAGAVPQRLRRNDVEHKQANFPAAYAVYSKCKGGLSQPPL